MQISVSNPFEEALQNREWRPTKRQAEFIQLPWDVDEAGYGGALMAGKSDVLMLLPLLYGFHENPRFKGLFLRRTFPELEQEIIPRSQEYYPSTGAVYNIAKHRWEFPSGALDIFGHLKDEKDVKKYDTGQFPLIRWDEATSCTGYQYEYLTLRRNRAPVGSGLPSFTRWGSNPGNIGHTYFRKRFLDPYKAAGRAIGSGILRHPISKTKFAFIPATLTDNPHANEANPKYFERLKGITSEAERRAMILGDWYVFEGQVFEEFRLEPLPDEPLNARHVIERFDIPDWWPKIIGIDWGMKAFTFIIWAALSPDGRVFIYRTYAVKGKKIKDWTRDLVDLTGKEKGQVRDVRICFSAVNDIGNDQTLFEQVADALEEANFPCTLTKGDRNRIAGKQLIHEYLRWKPLKSIREQIGDQFSQETANKIYRLYGENALQKYSIQFDEIKEDNLPKLQIMSFSPEGRENSELIEVIPSCVYDEVKKEDVKEFDGDDSYDCLRILLYAVRDYKDEFPKENEAIIRASKAETPTDAYRIMAESEAKKGKGSQFRRRSFFGSRMSRLQRASSRAGFRAG